MKIKEITFEMGNDFAAVMECEHCNATQKLTSGYHDNFYHTRVIPAMTCKACGKNRDGIVPETENNNGGQPITIGDILATPKIVC